MHFIYCCGVHPHLHSFPTRRSSDLGMNCLAIEQHDGILVVDCGTSFPHDDLGVDVLHPDFTWLIERAAHVKGIDRKSTRLNSSHLVISYAVFCLKKKTKQTAHSARN